MTVSLRLVAALGLTACTSSSPLADARFATGSRTVTANADYTVLYAVNMDEGSVSSLNLSTQAVEERFVGLTPTRIARAGSRLYVTLGGEQAIAVLQDTPAGLVDVGRVEVGVEPYGIVANEAGTRVYVSASQSSTVVAVDTNTQSITSTWRVQHQPRWLALHPSGDALYVASSRSPFITVVPLDDVGDRDGPAERIPLPTTTRNTPDGSVELTPRITGDPAVDPTGEHLVVPTLYVDNTSRQTVPEGLDPTTNYYVNVSAGVGRFNPALVTFELQADGDIGRRGATPLFLAGFREGPFGVRTVRSYPSSVTVSPDGLTYLTSLEGSGALIAVGALPYTFGATHDTWIAATEEPIQSGFVEHPHYTITTGDGPRGVLFDSNESIVVHNFMDRTLQPIPVGDALSVVEQRGLYGLDDAQFQDARSLPATLLANSALSPDVQTGRDLFYNAEHVELVQSGSGVSCATCHMDGRDDGLTWQLGPDARQTPSLAGTVSDTHPVTWTQDVPDVATEAMLTSTTRMGGNAAQSGLYDKMAQFIDHTRGPQPLVAPDPVIALGRDLFHRDDVGCASCHSGPAFTDNAFYPMYGLDQVNTPTLLGIAATAPYLHDGRARTLRDVLEGSRAGAMGDTSSLTEPEMVALEAYLKSL